MIDHLLLVIKFGGKYKFYYTYSQSKAKLRSWNMKGNKNRNPVATVLELERREREEERGRRRERGRKRRERGAERREEETGEWHLTAPRVFRVKRSSEPPSLAPSFNERASRAPRGLGTDLRKQRVRVKARTTSRPLAAWSSALKVKGQAVSVVQFGRKVATSLMLCWQPFP